MILTVKLRFFPIPTLLAIVSFLVVASGTTHASQPVGCDAELIRATYMAADHLEKHLESRLDRVAPILPTGFENLEGPERHTPFGRLLGQQVASRLSQHGYHVIDPVRSIAGHSVKENTDTPPRPKDAKGIDISHGAEAVILGEYIVLGNLAYASVRLVTLRDNAILASWDFSIRLNDALKEMATRVVSSDKSPTRPQHKTQTTGETDADPSRRQSEKTSPRHREQGDTTEGDRPGMGPFASGEIALHPSNPLAVKIIQTRLADLGFYRDKIDGVWKGNSKMALKQFKEARGLNYALKWDMTTQKALFEGTEQ